ncbi:D-alanyl-D-alanine carboxypeptidase/D-alanyl-D-alanine-endopeptidase [Burkholderia stagnalis]|uniref:D-alanyl-D-alanine carboxypeptidase n=1 Tax=Burkholderia stagnalis TaxID=1503054 RepID=A0A108A4A6_9BURK|nr:D-alanyl-D-alanine carboxypeptidase/D-alanyl-D-alanine-endopeptidase [Burkholderia stagnalis]KVZ06605.1 D-alanyl-D-alanine carboxypeptidase [Burkholderia stagnalis]KWA48029.1 D-alanyl-D-alanine carboxypeptidase [Burkholderia stagnalis]KWA53267.1 D-alanyl-D-alanine carboxypeptidase [Burkholderia stagnalis]KWA66961.1 D-alanyl-D-alanine carboxypeptidase [Burkholderia stagnalis]KWC95287.1 D-alanyl-D-alanine carboxypeptidase [Burkholderia stagnalis]
MPISVLAARFAPRARLCLRTAAVLSACTALAFAPSAQARKKALKPAHKPPAVSAAARAAGLPPAVLVALQRAKVPASAMSVVVERVGDPEPLIAWNASRPMLPASTMKLVTTFSGLSILGPDFRWRTSAYADGPVDPDGTLQGNLYIKGTGDPKLVPEELIDLVEKIRKAGIRRVNGGLVLDKTYFAASTRDLPAFDDDASAPYNVGPDPLLYAFKAISFTVTPGDDGKVAVDVLPPLANLSIDNQLYEGGGSCGAAASAARPTLTAGDGMLTASFAGDYPLRCGARTTNLAILDHTTFFARGFLALWQQDGGTIAGPVSEGKVPATARPVAVHHSPVLGSVVYDINKFSNNVMARNLFLTIGAESGKPPATPEQSSRVIRAFLQKNGVAMPDLALDNGSGLSRDEHVSAQSLAALLQAANASPVAQAFIDSLPIAGIDGTMKNRLTNAGVLGNAHIKTGTLRDVRAIAGYVAGADGTSYVVVSFINDDHAEAARAAHDSLLEWIYAGAH